MRRSLISTQALGGKATVVLLTQDTMEYLAPRFEAMRDGLNAIPGVTIVADIAPKPVSKEGGFAVMNKILLANSRIDVVLGGDAVVLGALAALRAAGKDRPDQFLGGIDGEPEGVAEIKKGNSPFKTSVSLSSPVFGYAMGQFAADWLVGKSYSPSDGHSSYRIDDRKYLPVRGRPGQSLGCVQ